MRTIAERMGRQVEIRLWQIVGITVALSGTWATGIYGLWRYFDDRDTIACAERNELRMDVRQAFEVAFDFFETRGTDPEVGDAVLAEIDRAIPRVPCP